MTDRISVCFSPQPANSMRRWMCSVIFFFPSRFFFFFSPRDVNSKSCRPRLLRWWPSGFPLCHPGAPPNCSLEYNLICFQETPGSHVKKEKKKKKGCKLVRFILSPTATVRVPAVQRRSCFVWPRKSLQRMGSQPFDDVMGFDVCV